MAIISGLKHKVESPVNKNKILERQTNIKKPVTKSNINSLIINNSCNHQCVMRKNKNRNFGNGLIVNKGQKISLNLNNNNIVVCAGWDIKDSRCDIDISAFMLDSSRKIISDEWFVFYGQPISPDYSIKLDSNGTNYDDKCILIDLSKMNKNVSRIVFVLTIDDAKIKMLNFSMVENAYIRILNNNSEIIRFHLNDYYDTVTSMMLGELYNHNNEWKFSSIGDGVNKDLAGLCEMYGVRTEQ